RTQAKTPPFQTTIRARNATTKQSVQGSILPSTTKRIFRRKKPIEFKIENDIPKTSDKEIGSVHKQQKNVVRKLTIPKSPNFSKGKAMFQDFKPINRDNSFRRSFSSNRRSSVKRNSGIIPSLMATPFTPRLSSKPLTT